MPTYRSITISLTSQFDILTIPEYAPPLAPNDPFSPIPVLVNPDHSLVSVYISTYPSSQFWISYSVSPSHPPKALYYFKLFLNGACVLSWGCSEADGYKGQTMFAMFDSGEIWMGRPTIEMRALCFGSEPEKAAKPHPNGLEDVMEIKVYRSKGRKRIPPQVQNFRDMSSMAARKSSKQGDAGGVNLVKAGPLPSNHPQRYYKYALVDPLDQPFATFRYYYRSWDQLEALGVISPIGSRDSSIDSPPTIKPVSSSPNLATTSARTHLFPPPVAKTPPYTPSPSPTPQKNPVTPHLISSLKISKSHSRSLPSSSGPNMFSSLRRSPSPPKRSISGRDTHSPTRNLFGKRSGSLGILKGVVNSAVMRRNWGVNAGELEGRIGGDGNNHEVMGSRGLGGEVEEEKPGEKESRGRGWRGIRIW